MLFRSAGFGVAAAEHQGVIGGVHRVLLAQAPGLLTVDAVGHGDEIFHHSSAEFFHIGLGVAVAAHAVVAQGGIPLIAGKFVNVYVGRLNQGDVMICRYSFSE